MILAVVRSASFGQDAAPQPEVTRALLQAKTVYIISGHVRYYKTKGFLKKELVDETPFEEPCRKELEKWGRFTLVPDIKGADLAVTPLLSLWMTDIGRLYPAYLLWGRSAVRLAIAALVYWLRPRHEHWEPVGNF